ncbi:hypothetical protein [Sulfuricurvum sp.]|uniref:type III-A CRISPR-associated RAMP protein Csm4 n=1 Tax=Sulfuricurvum sp. TaxID=2025608 RepID=UPI002626C017|nr:hypothetical protein [Sulfuricurvum sp.]MDD3596352.1 hypothetical protein [Sulfuricurvum sp.]
MMQLYRFDLQLKSAFATPPKGDTLFGQLCWMIVRTFGENKLNELLEGYTNDNPFMVVSDFLPSNHFQLPPIPRWMIDESEFQIAERKRLKNLVMIDIETLVSNNYRLDNHLLSTAKDKNDFLPSEEIQMRVTINRETGTTGSGFDPFANVRFEYGESSVVALYILLDIERLADADVHSLLDLLGKTGFGKDATIGRGQFGIISATPVIWDYANANGCITLSPSVLTQSNIEAFYEPFTRWGKHGDHLANTHSIWKNPILMADTFACILRSNTMPYVGKGLGGDGSISHTMPQTVHQGYAIGLPINVVLKSSPQ